MRNFVIAALLGYVSAINVGKKDQDICTPMKKLGNEPLQGQFFERFKMNGDLFESEKKYWAQALIDGKEAGGGFYDWNVVKKLDKESIEIAEGWMKEPANIEVMKHCKLEEYSVPSAGDRNIKMWTLKHVEAPKDGRVTIISLTHGGSALFGNAYQNQIERCKDIQRMGKDVFYVFPQYRRPPEIRQPESFKDIAKVVEYLYTNDKKFGIDKHKIGIDGASGAGYIASGAGMILAEQNKSHMVKGIMLIFPMLDDTMWTSYNAANWDYDKFNGPVFKSIFALHAKDLEKQHNDPHMFPTRMSDEVIKKFPDTVFHTTEYDLFRREQRIFAERLQKVNHLKEYSIVPGSLHGLAGSKREKWVMDIYPSNQSKWVECYLRRNNGKK